VLFKLGHSDKKIIQVTWYLESYDIISVFCHCDVMSRVACLSLVKDRDIFTW